MLMPAAAKETLDRAAMSREFLCDFAAAHLTLKTHESGVLACRAVLPCAAAAGLGLGVAHLEQVTLILEGHDFRTNNASAGVEGHDVLHHRLALALHSDHAGDLDDWIPLCARKSLQRRVEQHSNSELQGPAC